MSTKESRRDVPFSAKPRPLEPYLQVRHWFVAEANFSALARANALVSDTNAPQIKLKISDVAAGAAKLDHDVGAPGRRQHVASEK